MQKLFVWCLWVLSLSAASIDIGQSDNVSLLEHAEIYLEKGANFEVSDVPPQEVFQPYMSSFISQGYLADEAVWVRFNLKNESAVTVKRFLHVNNSMLDSVILYDDQGHILKSGVLYRTEYSDIFDYFFPIQLNSLEERTFYLKVLTNSCATYFHLHAESEAVLWKKTLDRQLILTLLFSVMGTLIVYNAFIYLFTKERVYLTYVFYLSVVVYNDLSYTGMLFPAMKLCGISYEGMIAWSYIDAYLGPLYTMGVTLAVLFFVRDFMHLERYPKIHRSFKWFFLGCLGFALIYLFGSDIIFDVIIYYMCFILLYILAIAVYLVYKKEENSLYFLVSWGVNILGTFMFLLYNIGMYIPKNGVYCYFYEMSMVFEGLVFSIILSKRLNRTKALAKALDTERILIRELHHRVKNNLQFIVSLYRLKLRPSLDAIGKAKLVEAESNVRSIGKIHEILHAHQNISELAASVYINDLIKEIKRGYPQSNITVVIEADEVVLSIDHAIYCGLIINELVTNALKYAFDAHEGEIILHLTYAQKTYCLEIYDNGKGFEWDDERDSFGLSLVKRLIHDELKGTLHYEQTHGSHYTIRWR
ncbi:7TM diverse intracellular signaling domain-containing protein [Sulfurospirillum cavolei]|uniref:7TM diverse intracellular signaling domain-containing protein n=1 Tax=Sulfurospirillum cavolei TaxID=366522 RepID=UPI000764A5C8|nr:7TM diverse intracellular signaling domain-containing protein [Sulfurospirillum cavolei]